MVVFPLRLAQGYLLIDSLCILTPKTKCQTKDDAERPDPPIFEKVDNSNNEVCVSNHQQGD